MPENNDTPNQRTPWFPGHWTPEEAFNPQVHLMDLNVTRDGAPKPGGRRLYLGAAARIAWWLEDQHRAIASGSAQVPFFLKVRVLELDTEKGLAVVEAHARDVWGNEATEMATCTRAEWSGGYVEKACTKAKSRCLATLGNGTLNALEFEEDEADMQLLADTPVDEDEVPTLQGIKQLAIAAGYVTVEDRRLLWQAAGVKQSEYPPVGDLFKLRNFIGKHPKTAQEPVTAQKGS
jgi:hypothetical protein